MQNMHISYINDNDKIAYKIYHNAIFKTNIIPSIIESILSHFNAFKVEDFA